MPKFFIVALILLLSCTSSNTQPPLEPSPGAYQFDSYLKLLSDKRVGITVNHSSLVGSTHLVDTLQELGIDVQKVFTPEHGFKGTASDGEEVLYEDDTLTFELISLYGKNKKPKPEQLNGLDLMIFDIQDVGARFYTYISTMHYLMEACAENDLPLLILDRPNPNGSYVDGPVLDTANRSFVGMHPVPIVHGMTVGEFAQMINGEGWLEDESTCELTVIPVANWDHDTPYSLPVRPSPNLPDDLSISLYPSLCLFEQTIMSVGRGTTYAFQQIGHPNYPDTSHSFTPKSWSGSKWPPFEDQKCYGISWQGQEPSYGLSLKPLLEVYQKMDSANFFKPYFHRLTGTKSLQEQIEKGWTEEEIRSSWTEELEAFKEKRKKYLIYQ